LIDLDEFVIGTDKFQGLKFFLAGQNTKLLTSEEEFSEGWVYGGFDAFTAHG
jgi:hypothetical protein